MKNRNTDNKIIEKLAASFQNVQEAQEQVTAAVMMDNSLIPIVKALPIDTFEDNKHKLIIKHAVNLYNQGKPADIVTISQSLISAGVIEEAGGINWIAQRPNVLHTTANFKHHLSIIVTSKIKKKNQEIFNHYSSDPDKLIEEFQKVKIKYTILGNQSNIDIQKQANSIITFNKISDIEIKPPEFLIQDIMEAYIFLLLFSKTGTGKTFLILDMAFCIAAGTSWHRHKVNKGLVVYFAGEGMQGISKRMRALSIKYGIPLNNIPFFISSRPANLTDKDFMLFVNESLKALPEKPVLIIIDTFNMNFGGGNENSTADMSLALQTLNEMKIETGATIAIIHHSGHSNTDRMRGNSALIAAMDRAYRIDLKGENLIFENTKSKETALNNPLTFHLESIDTGIKDVNKNIITSAVLMASEDITEQENSNLTGKWQKIGLTILENLYDQQINILSEGGIDNTNINVKIEDWKAECKKAQMSRQRVPNVLKSLIEKNKVYIELPHIYLKDRQGFRERPFLGLYNNPKTKQDTLKNNPNITNNTENNKNVTETGQKTSKTIQKQNITNSSRIKTKQDNIPRNNKTQKEAV